MTTTFNPNYYNRLEKLQNIIQNRAHYYLDGDTSMSKYYHAELFLNHMSAGFWLGNLKDIAKKTFDFNFKSDNFGGKAFTTEPLFGFFNLSIS